MLEEKIKKMVELLESVSARATKFDGGVNAAGTDVNKAMIQIKDMAKDARSYVSETRKARKENK